MKPQVNRRAYHSPQRRAGAAETRRRILASARRLFVTGGYGATTIEAIAAEAEVAAQTIFAAFGSKRGILFALLDQMAADADPGRLRAMIEVAAGDPRRQLRAEIAFNIRFFARGIALIDLARTVSGAEPDLRALWNEGEARRRKADAALVADWARAGTLAPGLGQREATDMLWALSGPDVFRLFVIERGWSQRRFEALVVETLERALFGAE